MTHNGTRQKEVDAVWSAVWQDGAPGGATSVFGNRLFIEGYHTLAAHVPRRAASLLETGTGSGRYAAALARDMPSLRVTATDILPESLMTVRALKEELNLSNLDIQQADVAMLPYPDDSFDVVLSDALIQHVPDDRRAVSEMLRVLKPGGTLIISGVNRWNFHGMNRLIQKILGRPYRYGMERLYTHGTLRRLIESAGGTVTRADGFFPAYGLYRLKRFWSGFGLLARAVNRITKVIDGVADGVLARWFGFEIVAVATKPLRSR